MTDIQIAPFLFRQGHRYTIYTKWPYTYTACTAVQKVNITSGHYQNSKDETPCTVILDTLKRIHVLNLHLDQTWCPGWRSEPASLSRCTKFILLFMWLIAIVLLVLSRHFAWTPHLCGLAGKDIEMARFLISSTNFSVCSFERVAIFKQNKKTCKGWQYLCHTSSHAQLNTIQILQVCALEQ